MTSNHYESRDHAIHVFGSIQEGKAPLQARVSPPVVPFIYLNKAYYIIFPESRE
jgi:hypothetical protein